MSDDMDQDALAAEWEAMAEDGDDLDLASEWEVTVTFISIDIMMILRLGFHLIIHSHHLIIVVVIITICYLDNSRK